MRTALFNEIIHNSGNVEKGSTKLANMLAQQRHTWGCSKNEEAVAELAFLIDFLVTPTATVTQDADAIIINNLDGDIVTVFDIDVEKNRAYITSSTISGEVYIEVVDNLLSITYAGEVFGIFPIDASLIGGRYV